ncbi:MAG: hypothetical protein M1820_010006 [Bogoriella megaspora]|nr:MAG: hypothetical protein M1820_010006 [Bogoriella megaspora]
MFATDLPAGSAGININSNSHSVQQYTFSSEDDAVPDSPHSSDAEPDHPLYGLGKKTVEQWMSATDILACNFIRLPEVQEAVSKSAEVRMESFDTMKMPSMFQVVALSLPEAPNPEEPIKFCSRGFTIKPGDQRVGGDHLLRMATGRTSLLSVQTGDHGRPDFYLHLATILLDATSGRPTYIVDNRVCLSDAIRESAVESQAELGASRMAYPQLEGRRQEGSQPEGPICEACEQSGSSSVRQWSRRGAVSMPSESFSKGDFNRLTFNQEREAAEHETEQGTHLSSSTLTRRGSERSSMAMSISTTSTARTSAGSLSTSSKPSSLLTIPNPEDFPSPPRALVPSNGRTGGKNAIAALSQLIHRIREHHSTCFVLAPPILPLRSRAAPKYEFQDYKITHISQSLHIPSSPPTPTIPSHSFHLTSMHETNSDLSPAYRPFAPTHKPKPTTFRTPASPQHPPSSNPYYPLSPTSPFAPPPRSYSSSTSTALLPPGLLSPSLPPHLTIPTLFKYTPPTILSSITTSMQAGRAFREFVMFRHPKEQHGMGMGNENGNGNEKGNWRKERQESDDEGQGSWLYGVPLGDGKREGLVCVWVCWIVGREVEDDLFVGE